jgi:hypothetical protein
VNSRTELINLLVQQNDMRGALGSYLDLADVYTQLADLEGARGQLPGGWIRIRHPPSLAVC